RLERGAFQDVAVGLADLGQRGTGAVHSDSLLKGDLEDLALLALVDVLVVVRTQFDLLDELPFHFIQGHRSLLPSPRWGEVGFDRRWRTSAGASQPVFRGAASA